MSPHSERGRPSSESDETETVNSRGVSEVDEEAIRVVVPDTVEDPEVDIPGPSGVTLREALASLDGVDPRVKIEKRAAVTKSIPKFLRGPFRNALKSALEEAAAGDDVRAARGWKLLVMLPRMLLHRQPGGGKIAKVSLVDRFRSFSQGQWRQLITASEQCDERAVTSRRLGRKE